MAQRKDGKITRTRLLAAACDVFGEKGFRDATVAQICRRADTNVAAVSYYFGSKDALYTEAWQQAFEKDIVPDLPESPDSAPEDRLRRKIHALVHKFCSPGAKGVFMKMYLMELANPTGLIDESWRRAIEPRRQYLLAMVREIAGPDVSDEAVRFCELSIVNQCRALLMLRTSDLEYLMEQTVSPELIQALADHILRFSLAGIRSCSHR
ncbi:MAG: CerR family C-terminal domain-containing protein [Pseudomonadota bacterium]